MPFLKNTNKQIGCYSYFKIMQNLQSNDKIKNIKIDLANQKIFTVYKEIIGFIKINNKIQFIDIEGNILNISDSCNNYIEITGKYELWHKYYHELKKINIELFKRIKKVHIYSHRIDIVLNNNILIKLYRSIKDLQDFYKEFPHLFEKNIQLDLRNPRIIGIKHLKV